VPVVSPPRRELARSGGASRQGQRGQVLPIFAIMAVVLLGGAALVTDAAWWWVNEQRMQRAADAGALAGAIHLPGNQALAFQRAHEETAKNGFTTGSNGVVVTPRRDPGDPRKLLVDIDGPVSTHFAKVFSIDRVEASVTGAASYVLPVKMGSPINYYGVFGKLRTPLGGEWVEGPATSQPPVTRSPSTGPTGQWSYVVCNSTQTSCSTSGSSVLSAAQSNNLEYAMTTATGSQHQFGGFGLLGSIPAPGANESLTITGIQVMLDDTWVSEACQSTYVEAHLSADGGATFSSAPSPNTLNDTPMLQSTVPNNANNPYGDHVIGSATSTATFPIGRAWTRDDLSDANLRVRLTARKGCSTTSAQVRVDHLQVRVYYTLTTSVFIPDANITDPYGRSLEPQGLWGTFINQGADKINGDAYLAKWDPRTSRTNAEYDPVSYYNYGLEIPAGASNGELWIYDPVFCAVTSRTGTGDRWFGGSNATSAYYTLYDTRGTPYVFEDDQERVSSGSLFANIRASDQTLGGPNLGAAGATTDCREGATSDQSDGRYWHNRWWRIASGLPAGTYRLHTRSTDPANPSAMDNANGHNSFALWSTATGGTPRIYGLSAMQAFTPLDAGGAATFFLAQIDAEHAGKTMVISLWDPGDTGVLPADLRILRPTATDYVVTPFNYSARQQASGAASCDARSGTNVTSVTTNTGGSNRFNGCWVTIEIPLPVDYSAPRPASETNPVVDGGWWKIRYDMGGSQSDDPAFDLTTWEVQLRGNPVHLVLK
jgi:Flp pilus assembly protein TadG